MHPAIQVCLRHNGTPVLNRAIGHGWGNRPRIRPTPRRCRSARRPVLRVLGGKAISTTVVHMLVERGAFSLDDRVCEYLPTYTGHGKERTTIRHVITHSAGIPFATGPRVDLKRMNDSDYAREMLGRMRPVYPPGLVHMYHGVTWGPLVREIVSAATAATSATSWPPRSSDPLGFRWTNYGVAEQDVPLVAPGHATGSRCRPDRAGVQTGGRRNPAPDHPFTNTPAFLTSVVPSSSTVSNADGLSRFAEILCREGELDGVRVMRPETLRAATRPDAPVAA